MSRGRRRVAFVAGAVVVAAVAVAWAAGGDDGRPTARVERRDLVATVDVEGELAAVESTTIGPPGVQGIWNYKISFIVPEGTEVTAGQPVLGFDTTELQQELREKTGERDAAAKEHEKATSELAIERQDLEMQLAEAEARLRRHALELEVPEDLVARHELAASRIDHRLAELEIESLRGSLVLLEGRTRARLASLAATRDRAARRVEEIEESLRKMQIAAPRAGTVIYVGEEDRRTRNVGDSVWRAETILEIPDLSRMRAEGEVGEADMGRVAPGQPVTLRLDAHPDHPYHGRVARLRRSVQRRSESDPTKVVAVVVELDGTDAERMRPGMHFRGTIEVDRAPDVLCLPLAAVDPRPDGAVVTVRRGLDEETVEPELGRRDTECVEVLSGLEEGDRVMLLGGDEA